MTHTRIVSPCGERAGQARGTGAHSRRQMADAVRPPPARQSRIDNSPSHYYRAPPSSILCVSFRTGHCVYALCEQS